MRFIGPFYSSNVAAMEMAVLISLSVVFCVLGIKHLLKPSISSKIHWVVGPGIIISALFTLISSYLLIATGSRAGVLGAIGCLGVLAYAKSISWRTAAFLIISLIVATLWAPYRGRFTGIATDSSALFRLTTWEAAIAAISDHPLSGIAKAQTVEVYEHWYLPIQEKPYHLASALNDPLTIGAYHGLPAMLLYAIIVSSAIYLGLQHARNGSVRAALGLCFLVPHIICGQFQAHLLIGSTIVYLMWAIGLALCFFHIPNKYHLKKLAIINFAIIIVCCSIPVIGSQLVSSAWKTETVDAHHTIAKPRHQKTKHVIVCIGLKNASAAQSAIWRTARLEGGEAIILCRDIPEASWMHKLNSHSAVTDLPISMYATGDRAGELWAQWRNDPNFGNIILADPSSIPQGPAPKIHTNKLTLHLSQFGFVRDAARMRQVAEADGGTVHTHRVLSTEWLNHDL